MFELLGDLYEKTSILDLIYLIITILSLIKCYKKGFVLSILSMAKWLFAYVITSNFSKSKTLLRRYY